MRLGIATDHRGYLLKRGLIKYLKKKNNIKVSDFGTRTKESCDYPDYAYKLIKGINAGEIQRGILICSSGIGMSIIGNRFKGIRAALCFNEKVAKFSRLHNNSNVLVIPADYLETEEIKSIIDIWLKEKFEGDRHIRRLKKIDLLSNGWQDNVKLVDDYISNVYIEKLNKIKNRVEFRILLKHLTMYLVKSFIEEFDKNKIRKQMKDCYLIPILNAGMGMVDAVKELLEDINLGIIGTFKEQDTLRIYEYYSSIDKIKNKIILITDPVFIYNRSGYYILKKLYKNNTIYILSITTGRKTIEKFKKEYPDAKIITCNIKNKVNSKKILG